MTNIFVETAPAKINLALHVTGRRPDGFHNLESLVVFAEIGDVLEARAAPADRLVLKGPFAEALTAGQANLVSRAVAGFRAQWPETVATGLEITLFKNLPVAAGIGGGSADAAAALRLMARLATTAIDPETLARLANRLGADVPVCLASRPSLVAGTGEVMRPLGGMPKMHAVLVNPLMPVPTAEIFKRLQKRDNPGLPGLPDPLAHATLLGLWLAETRNDLEEPAIAYAPVIGTLIAALAKTNGCILSRMSGSGATVFALYGSEGLAHQAAAELRRLYPGFWVAATPIMTD